MNVNGPALWSRVLAPIRQVYGSGIIAGGAVRDYLIGEPPKDIDVFGNVADRESLVAGIGSLPVGWGLTLMEGAQITEYETAPDWTSEVHGVLEGFVPESQDFALDAFSLQIIARPMPDFSGPALIQRFDLGITRSWFDGSIHDTPEAEADRANGTLTLLRWDSEAHVKASERRVDRLRDRFGYRYVDPRPELATA